MSLVVVVHQNGGPEALTVEQRDPGRPRPGQVRLRQTAIGLNFVDTYQRSGLYSQQLPVIPGNEAVGVVTEIGEGVSTFAIGDRVGYAGVIGAYAQDRLIDADRLFPIPDAVDDRTAAAVMLKGMTAYFLLFQTWKGQIGQTILWHAAAGGVGLLACQWAAAIGIRVIGTVGSREKRAIAEASGCSDIIDYSEDVDFAARVRTLTNGEGVDVVFDGIGNATFERSLNCLKPRGLMVSFGNASGVVTIPDLGILARKGSLYLTRPIMSDYLNTTDGLRAASAAVFDAVQSGTLSVHIGAEWPLAKAADAHRALENRLTIGASILAP